MSLYIFTYIIRKIREILEYQNFECYHVFIVIIRRRALTFNKVFFLEIFGVCEK